APPAFGCGGRARQTDSGATGRITALEQQAVDLTGQLEERNEELQAARAANRQLISRLNTSH
ncbi:hypothetical protein ACFC58_43135, partial [Kitasatospora purpeofusca]